MALPSLIRKQYNSQIYSNLHSFYSRTHSLGFFHVWQGISQCDTFPEKSHLHDPHENIITQGFQWGSKMRERLAIYAKRENPKRCIYKWRLFSLRWKEVKILGLASGLKVLAVVCVCVCQGSGARQCQWCTRWPRRHSCRQRWAGHSPSTPSTRLNSPPPNVATTWDIPSYSHPSPATSAATPAYITVASLLLFWHPLYLHLILLFSPSTLPCTAVWSCFCCSCCFCYTSASTSTATGHPCTAFTATVLPFTVFLRIFPLSPVTAVASVAVNSIFACFYVTCDPGAHFHCSSSYCLYWPHFCAYFCVYCSSLTVYKGKIGSLYCTSDQEKVRVCVYPCSILRCSLLQFIQGHCFN